MCSTATGLAPGTTAGTSVFTCATATSVSVTIIVQDMHFVIVVWPPLLSVRLVFGSI